MPWLGVGTADSERVIGRVTVSQAYGDGAKLLELAADESRDVLLDVVAARVLRLLDATAVTVTLVERGLAATIATTDDELVVLDEVQYAADDGPCLEALRTQVVVRADIALARLRWPTFARTATDVGVLTMMSCPLFLPGDGADAHRRAGDERIAGAVNIRPTARFATSPT